LADHLLRQGIAAGRIHGNRSQAQRTEALASFKAGKLLVLVATDVAARGIDVSGLSHVVNFDVPGSPEDYVHRVGRTARAGATGDAFVLVSPEEEAGLREIERVLGRRLQRVTVPGFDYQRKPAHRLETRRPHRWPTSTPRRRREPDPPVGARAKRGPRRPL
jgi:ATP-dependent RNA helicase RhlE